MTAGAHPLKRLLAPRHIAVYGGATAARVVRQCRAVGYEGELWPVHPRRDHIEGLPCHLSTGELPAAPDAAFLAVPARATVDVLAALARRGAGGAVCHASGFAEDGPGGAALEDALRTAAGDMPVIGPNCLGVLNYLDGTALWADQHGGARTDSGVAVITQSGNIGQNLTMQRRALPLAYLITAGNSAVTDTPQLIEALLEDPRVTAIGLHLEGIADPAALARAALSALRRGVPVVALKTGTSTLGAQTAMSHTSSLAGPDELCEALFRRTGVARVPEIGTFVETLKLLHVHGPLTGGQDPAGRARITSASCSGGEAALLADTAQRHGLELPPLPQRSAARLREVLGDQVHIRNPLDYHTYIWGDFAAQRECFTALLGAGCDLNVLLLDMPRADRCEADAWTTTLDAYAAAQRRTGAPACVVGSLPEGVPEPVAQQLLSQGIAPLQGLADGVRAIAAAHRIGAARRTVDQALPPAGPVRQPRTGRVELLDEYAGKQELAGYGLPVPDSAVAAPREAARVARTLGFPVAAKALAADLAHKSEAGGVHLGLTDQTAVEEAVSAMAGLADSFLIERMVPDAVAELLVGVHHDPAFGPALTLGAGGVLVELVRDTATLLLPATDEEIAAALATLRAGPLLRGFRGRPAGDVPAAVAAVQSVAGYVRDHPEVTELDVNPLLVLPEGQGAIAADVLISRLAPQRADRPDAPE
ncbi:acetate--CoA ligase family protein [Streptomyces oryzae]|uniref:Acetate--CoA ligase family protein n=1 Tax=Streptomyces oryzae TaxID=1434886 RepID=A0ABS3X7D2_9ACTN|nr:acetate--CoA ligase family protein [Streptomyces oryzae]MBO8191001.1 acetate--CoA ligase family protein [Streptomyces oryzae]